MINFVKTALAIAVIGAAVVKFSEKELKKVFYSEDFFTLYPDANKVHDLCQKGKDEACYKTAVMAKELDFPEIADKYMRMACDKKVKKACDDIRLAKGSEEDRINHHVDACRAREGDSCLWMGKYYELDNNRDFAAKYFQDGCDLKNKEACGKLEAYLQ